MLTREETERLAAAVHALRADWPTGSLCTFIWERRERPLLDLTLELAYVATIPGTDTPARIDQDGPWKRLNRTEPVNTSAHLGSIDFGADCIECFKPREHLWHGNTGTIHDHEYASRRDHQPAPRPEKETA